MSHGAKQDPPSLDEFAKRLDAARGDGDAKAGPSGRANGVALARGFRVGSELLAGMLVGALLGWGLDALAGTKPIWLLIGMFLGFAAGVLNVRRAMNATGAEFSQAAPASEPFDED